MPWELSELTFDLHHLFIQFFKKNGIQAYISIEEILSLVVYGVCSSEVSDVMF